jgi:hypothetical protein
MISTGSTANEMLGKDDESNKPSEKKWFALDLENYSGVRRRQTREAAQILALSLRNFNTHNIAERSSSDERVFSFIQRIVL